MKRRDLLRHLEKHSCEFLRERGNHTIYVNSRAQKSSAIPRHREIIDFLAQKIRRDLDIPTRHETRNATAFVSLW
jgi:mRNA interferase HicA